MSVEELKVVDIISTTREGRVVLTISDHLDWKETRDHLLILQEKINSYLAFLESGEIFEKYPDAKNRGLGIKIVFTYQPTSEANFFLRKAKAIVEEAGFGFGFELFSATPYQI
jgi:hypothetical protein